ncbi:hypothetical protein [Bdellovibrio svalbardensis]|uniref:Lipoprotein n=1 Tax=Bdellovibrio svalbardensis TaxID=2972972 RepID=A0ABT6DHE5_9BACT|nr:hypothetical protein [Bdellovibrio svalbardensis]MDG0816237.1 hypothetical protein [Bdellovibrio svalbardensis]
MKNLNTKLLILLAGFSLMGVGCGKNQLQANSTNVVSDGTILPGGEIPGAPDSTTTSSGSYTNTATFVPVSLAEFNSYVASHPLNNPSNFKITVELQKTASSRYGGTVKLSYTDTGYQYAGTFTAGTGTNVSMSGLKDNGTEESQFNYWYASGGKAVFSGMFQDSQGAIVVVVDSMINQGDAQGGSVVSGSVYYKNFAQSYATQSPYRKCWFIYNGPYNCRDSAIINKSSLIPSDGGYRKLGTFTGLSKSQAFAQ